MLEKKKCLADNQLTYNGKIRYCENMKTVVFSCINFSVKQKSLNKQDSTRKNICYSELSN